MTKLRRPARPLPDPGARFDWLWRPGEQMVRIYHRHPGRPPLAPRTFGPLARLDPHVQTTGRRPREQPDGRAANYLADELGCALAEAFQDQESDHIQVCPNYFSVAAAPTRVVRLLDLTGDGARGRW